MILRRPTKVTLKMEDDYKDYEEHRDKLIHEQQSSKTSLNMNPSAFMTPGSNKVEPPLDMLQEEAVDNVGPYVTPQRIRHREPGNSARGSQDRSSEYISNLLHNIYPDRRGQ